jgi:hypothetical protein
VDIADNRSISRYITGQTYYVDGALIAGGHPW